MANEQLREEVGGDENEAGSSQTISRNLNNPQTQEPLLQLPSLNDCEKYQQTRARNTGFLRETALKERSLDGNDGD